MLEGESNFRRRELGERNLPFAQLTMAVILGVVIQGAATSLSRESLLRNYRAILIVTALLLFVEMYIVLLRYHSRLHLPYVNLYMFSDLVISILFVSCVTLIANSWDQKVQLDIALEVLGVLFIALLARQVFAFLSLIFQSRDVERVLQYSSQSDQLRAINFDLVFRNEDIRSRLTAIRLNQWALFVPMIADLAGIGFAVGGLLFFDISWWAWVGLVCFLVYEFIMFGLVIGATQTARQIPHSVGMPPVEEGQRKASP
jgi:hypothetical protein